MSDTEKPENDIPRRRMMATISTNDHITYTILLEEKLAKQQRVIEMARATLINCDQQLSLLAKDAENNPWVQEIRKILAVLSE